MLHQEPAIFDGLPAQRLDRELQRTEHRQVAAGATLIAEGEPPPHEVYVVQSGHADVCVADGRGGEHLLSRLGAGATIGEMSLFSGQPAAATVRAATDLDLLVLSEPEFRRLAGRFPRIYRNLGAILAARLARTDHQVADVGLGRITVLIDRGSPALLGYALACSLAWHTRGPVLHVVLSDEAPEALASHVTGAVAPAHRTGGGRGISQAPPARADLLVTPAAGAFGPDALPGTVRELAEHFDHVLVQARGATLPVASDHTIVLGKDAATVASAVVRYPGHAVWGWAEGQTGGRPDRQGVLAVPSPAEADLEALRAGTLAPRGGFGRALGWLARDIAGLKVGLALGAGAVKGYAHIGVLRVLAQLGVPIDYISGTSIGAIVAGSYACGFDPDVIAAAMDEVGGAAFRLTVSRNSLLSSAGLRAGMQRRLGERRIEDLPIPLAIVAVDITARQEVVFRRGRLWPAMLASASIPGVYPPVRMGRYTLVDGGVLNPVPTNAVAAMGADVVIAVKLSNHPAPSGDIAGALPVSEGAASVLQAITRTIDLMQSKIVADTAATATILLEPAFQDADGFGLRNFSQGRKYIRLGEETTLAARPQLAVALPWLR